MNLARSAAVVTLLVLVACDSATNATYRPPPLATLRGTMTTSQGLTLGGAVHLSVLWFSSEGGRPGSLLGVVADEVAYTGMFPQAYALALEGLPPIGALRADDAGTVGAVGVIVAYEDLNGDGQLTLSRGGPVVDRVLGASSRAFVSARAGVVEPESRYLLYLDTVGAAFTNVAQTGYHLQTVSIADGGATSASTLQPVASAMVPLELTATPDLALLACGEFYDALGTTEFVTKTLCGLSQPTPPVNPMTMTGTIAIFGDAGIASITLGAPLLDGGIVVAPGAADASVSLNGVLLRASSAGQFTLYETQATVIREDNVVRVATSGGAPWERRCTIPAVHFVIPPTVSAGQPATISWSGPGSVVAMLGTQTALSPATSVTTQAPLDGGSLSYSVSASDQPLLVNAPLRCSRNLVGSIQVTP